MRKVDFPLPRVLAFMRISAFIRANTQPIIVEWQDFAATLVPSGGTVSLRGLRDHIVEILAFIADDMDTAQSKAEQQEKAHGDKLRDPVESAAEIHASLRYDDGFNMDQMVSEYRALRASVVKLWLKRPIENENDINDLTRFHEAIDQALTESIHGYTEKMDQSRNLFLGILGHDIRNPLGAISMSAQLMKRIGTFSDREKMLLSQIVDSTDRANEIVTHLLDLTRSRLGSGIPVIKEPMNLGFVCKQIIDEMRVMKPEREFHISTTGDLEGEWDKARLAQVVSNLLSNAVQYGFKRSPITLKAEGQGDSVRVSVHNEGVPIPPDAVSKIFDSLTRGDEATAEGATNLGLGLYIAKQVIVAHGGTITVTSSESDGTLFTCLLPRHETAVPPPAS